MLIEGPHLPPSDAGLDEKVAAYVFLGFTLRAIYLSLFLIIACAQWVQTTTSIPASDYSLFIKSVALKETPWIADPGDYVYMLYGQLLLAAAALCYLYYGVAGLAMCLFAFWRFVSKSAGNIVAWQRALTSFEESLGAPPGTYVSSWRNYGQGCCGMTAALWNTVFGHGSYRCFLGQDISKSRAAPLSSQSSYAFLPPQRLPPPSDALVMA